MSAALGVLFLLCWNFPAIASSRETWICLKNITTAPVNILVTDIDNFDWDGNSRPDHTWYNVNLAPGAAPRCERAEVNSSVIGANFATGAKFTFILNNSSRVRLYYDGHVAQLWQAQGDWVTPEALVLLGSKFGNLSDECDPKALVNGGCFDYRGWMWPYVAIYPPGKKCPIDKQFCSYFEIGKFDPAMYPPNK